MHWRDFNQRYDLLQRQEPGAVVLLRDGDVFIGRGARVSLAHAVVPLPLYAGPDGVIRTRIPSTELDVYVRELGAAGIPVYVEAGTETA